MSTARHIYDILKWLKVSACFLQKEVWHSQCCTEAWHLSEWGIWIGYLQLQLIKGSVGESCGDDQARVPAEIKFRTMW